MTTNIPLSLQPSSYHYDHHHHHPHHHHNHHPTITTITLPLSPSQAPSLQSSLPPQLNSSKTEFFLFFSKLGTKGGLTDWMGPETCSRSCGGGIQFLTKTCTNPKPSLDGADCVGETKQLVRQWCNTHVSFNKS